jgi:hypothetical protein
MRRFSIALAVLGVFAGAAATGTAAQAQNYPWCSMFADGAGVNCGYSTYEQCQAAARGGGGYCAQNNMYTPPAATAASHHVGRKHRRTKISD